jgi:solute carrier family 13 (sodium-dependent dicarboxylate transporter), member 2/3/5
MRGHVVTAPAVLKVDLAVRGARLDSSVRERGDLFTAAGREGPITSLGLVLPDDLCVTVPIDERSPFVLVAEGRRQFLLCPNGGEGERARIEVRAVPRPRFYDRLTSRGMEMSRIATVHGSHLVVHPSAACGYSVRGTPCRFCVEGARVQANDDAVPVPDVLEVVRAAFDEGVCDVIYFNTAFGAGEDGGVGFLAPYVQAVRKHFDTLIATQLHPPRTNDWIDRTYAMGVDAVSYNLEIFDSDLLNRHCIGRARYIGRGRYLEALGYAASIFPSGTVWSDLVLGLEPVSSTMAGIDAFAAMGVVPVVAIARSEGSSLPPAELEGLLAHLHRAVKERGINMGWVRDLALGVTPLEARHCAGEGARLAVTVQQLTRWRLGGLAARSLARFRRRLRVRRVRDSFDAAHL